MAGTRDIGAGAAGGKWYELFSRGARDWLRHDEKVRAAVRAHLPQAVADGELIGGGARTVRVPVRLLEHYRFRLHPGAPQRGVGQGPVRAGDVFDDPGQATAAAGKGEGGEDDGGVRLLLEFKIDDIVEWLWEEMRLPNLAVRDAAAPDEDWTRQGWDRRGARSRLDRRRTFREMLKRRTAPGAVPTFTDADLRYRQLARRRRPAMRAVVFFLLDVSGSMSARDRQLAKSFFFWTVQGLRREYRTLETVFVAHTTAAWEFAEAEFFQVSGSGGTVASSGFAKVSEIVRERFDPHSWNVFLLYASDGDNALADAHAARAALAHLAAATRFCGYVEVAAGLSRHLDTETGRLFASLAAEGASTASFALAEFDDVWGAIRAFFTAQQRVPGAS